MVAARRLERRQGQGAARRGWRTAQRASRARHRVGAEGQGARHAPSLERRAMREAPPRPGRRRRSGATPVPPLRGAHQTRSCKEAARARPVSCQQSLPPRPSKKGLKKKNYVGPRWASSSAASAYPRTAHRASSMCCKSQGEASGRAVASNLVDVFARNTYNDLESSKSSQSDKEASYSDARQPTRVGREATTDGPANMRDESIAANHRSSDSNVKWTRPLSDAVLDEPSRRLRACAHPQASHMWTVFVWHGQAVEPLVKARAKNPELRV